MKTFEKLAAQGDVMFERIDAVPSGAKKETPKRGPVIVAHSETGHHHAFDAAFGVDIFRLNNDPMVCYLSISEPYADLVHHRPFDTHETIRFSKGVYKVRRQREHTPSGWRRVED